MTPALEPQQPSVITFYAYKGGTGRSMALANSACLAARKVSGGSARVLIMDWDLEAPGLHKFFPAAETSANRSRRGVIEYFSELSRLLEDRKDLYGEIQQPDGVRKLDRALPLDYFIISDVVPGVDMIRAGALNDDYSDLLGSFSWVRFFQLFPFAFRVFRSLVTSRYELVFVDSRTGLTDVGGICTSIFPDKLVAVFTPNEQSLSGLMSIVRQAVTYRRFADDFRSLAVYPLPSRVEVHAEQELRKQWRARYQSGFERLFCDIYSLPDCKLGPYFDEVELPHVPYYLFGERIAVNEAGEDALSLKKAYERFFDQLAGWNSAWERTEASLPTTETSPLGPDLPLTPIEPPTPRDLYPSMAPGAESLPIELIAREFVEGRIFPFLGDGVNFVGRPQGSSWNDSDPSPPTAGELARYLAASTESLEIESQDLSRVSQYVALSEGPRPLYNLLSKALREVRQPSPIHRFLASSLAALRRHSGLTLIVTTTYDESVEYAMSNAGVEFEVISYVAEGEGRGRFSHRTFNGESRIIDRPNTYMDVGLHGRPVILRLLGAIDTRSADPPSPAITEDHMLAYADGRNLRYLLPPPVVIKLQESVPLFLGFSIVDWPQRLLFSRLPGQRAKRVRGWTVSLRPSQFERRLWAAYGINAVEETLDTLIARLQERIGSISAQGELL